MQHTEHYGDRLMYVIEACQNYFEYFIRIDLKMVYIQ